MEEQNEAKDDKKKKKDDKKKKPAKVSAMGKAILLRQQQIAAEEERLKKLQEEEDRKIREQEEREEAERKAIEDEKERKRKAKAAKVEAQKAAGTYMTKAEKERHKKAQARLEAMKAAGMVVPSEEAAKIRQAVSTASENQKTSAAALMKKKARPATEKNSGNDVPDPDLALNSVEVPAEDAVANLNGTTLLTTESPFVEEEKEWDEEEDWDAKDDDDWLASKVGAVAAKAEQFVSPNAAEEDTLVEEQRKELEKLRILGQERARREEENRIRRYRIFLKSFVYSVRFNVRIKNG